MTFDNLLKRLKALTPLLLILVACAALFLGISGMGEWAAACGSILAIWLGMKGYQAAKARKNENLD
jgi:hypothetical protein